MVAAPSGTSEPLPSSDVIGARTKAYRPGSGRNAGDLPNQPTLPLFPGESVLSTFSSDPKSMARIIRFNMMVMVVIFLAILVPIVLLTLSTGPFDPIILVVLFPVALIAGMAASSAWTAGRQKPTVAFVTNRRVLVDSYGREASSAAIGLEAIGNVQLDQSARAMRRVGVCWVYLLPMGTNAPLVGSGRYRHPAPGVVWMTAVPLTTGEALRSLVIQQAHDVQVKLGYPNPIASV